MKAKRIVSGLLCAMLLTNMVTAGAIGQTDVSLEEGLFSAPPGTIRESATQSVSPPETVPLTTLEGDAREINFDENWRFNFGDAAGAQGAAFNDSAWTGVNLPHDFSITQEFTKAGEAESGYLLGGTGWYRKQFSIPASWAGKTVTLDFGGAYMDTTVYLNGDELGQHHYGYTPFSFTLPADKLIYGGNNLIAVKVVNTTPSSRWYSGSGIYRSVNLTVTDAVHVARYGTTVTTPNVAAGTVSIKTEVQNDGAAAVPVSVRHSIYYYLDDDTAVATATGAAVSVGALGIATDSATLTVPDPKLWDIGAGSLYSVRTEVLGAGGAVLDTYDTSFGFRTFNFNRTNGFELNGRAVKLQGMCMHHDQGALGSVANYRATERQVEILQEMGVNAIRVTHNPASDELIEICDRKGMLVIDEAFDTWEKPKNGNSNDFSKWFNTEVGANPLVGVDSTMTWAEVAVRAMVSRGKNAPSVIAWSLGNEIFEGLSSDPAAGHYADVAVNMIGWVKSIDATRPTTFGGNKIKASHAEEEAVARVIADNGGVVGLNYADSTQFQTIYNDNENWNIYGAETASAVNSRGVYDYKGSGGATGNKRLTSYDKSAVGWGAVASDGWYRVLQQDFNAGEFVWTGFDYIGEPTPWNGTGSGAVGGWPSPKSSYFGVIDTNGFPKDSFYFYQSQWNKTKNTLHILPTWNENEVLKDANGKVEVVVYSDAAKVKLEYISVDGTVTDLGTKEFTKVTTPAGYTYQIYKGAGASTTAHQNLYLTWLVPYAAGTLKATAFDAEGNVISETQGRASVQTSPASKLSVTADRDTIRADGKDLSYVTIDVQDALGNLVNGTIAQPEIKLSITGNGKIVGTDNGVQADHTSYQSLTKKAGAGKLLAIVQADQKTGGSFTLSATASGLNAGSVTVNTTPVSESGVKRAVSYTMSRNYYVQTGSMPTLPATVTVNYSDGSTQQRVATWDAITNEQINTTGSFVVGGRLGGESFPVTVTVNMMSGVAALLNYSTAVVAGSTPTLPSSRPAVMADGTVTSAELDVSWDMPDASAFAAPGIVTIPGTANAFGQSFTVKATVRVGQYGAALGGNVAAAAAEMATTVASGSQTGTLASLKDGITADSPWTATATSADVRFRYDTAQNLGQAAVYVYTRADDTAPVTAPNSIKLEWSPDGTVWNDIAATAGDPVTTGNVTKHPFTFAGVPAVQLRVTLNNAAGATCGLTEIELYTVTDEFNLNTSADFTEITLNGIAATASQLEARSVSTPALKIKTFEPKSANASYTMLPAVDNQVLVITESEDDATRRQYKLVLGAAPSASRDPSDASLDYDYTKTTASAESQQDPGGSATEGPIRFAVDGNIATYWHSKWNEDLTSTPEKRYIMLTLDAPATLEGLRYLPRPSVANGIVTAYRVETSMDNTNWTTASTGTWAHDTSWKFAQFAAPTEAQYIKLYGVQTKGSPGDVPDKFMSAAEVRVCTPDLSKPDLSDAIVTLSDTEFARTGNEIKPDATVTLNGAELEYGYDYVLRYENNVEIGTATAKVMGILDYRGMASANFTIVEPSIYTITYDLAGGLVAASNPATYTAADAAITLNNPTRDGYTFAGWTGTGLTGATMTVVIANGSTGNRTYTATWTKNGEPAPAKHTVSFNANGGSEIAPVQVDDGQALAKPQDPTRSGFRFRSWYADAALTITYDFAKPVTADLTLYASWSKKSSGGGDSGGGSTGGGTTEPGGSTTTETTKPDGSKETTVVNRDTGETTVTTKATDGGQSTVKTDRDGKVTAEVTLSTKAENKAVLPMPDMKPATSAANAPSVTIKTDKAMTVTIPVADKSDSVVAIIVDKDGKETILPKAAMSENGLQVPVSGQTTIKLVNNQKSFADVSASSWASSAVDFVTSRELFNGTSANSFSPNEKMTRGMLVTVLWRYESKPEGGSAAFGDVGADEYFAQAVAWASSKNIVTGTGAGFTPNGDITREQLAAILYRYAGSPATDSKLDTFGDGGKVSSYASDAMRWAVGTGVISGKNGDLLAPQDSATRAEVAAMLQRFVKASA